MKKQIISLILCNLFLFACKEATRTNANVKANKAIEDSTALVNAEQTTVLLDQCDNSNYSAVLEKDKNKGNDSCILSIKSLTKAKDKVEVLNLPANKTSLNYCEKEYVVLGFSCGGPCYSQEFVFTDGRKNKQFSYGQKISNNPNILAHIRNEKFEKLIICNLKNGKELMVQNPDINETQYGQMDTMYIVGNDLKLEYQTINKQTKKKSVSLNNIMK